MAGKQTKTRLTGLSEKIFLDRYALKDADTNNTKVGDVVLVLTKDDPKFPTKEVGEVIERDGRKVKVKMRSEQVVEADHREAHPHYRENAGRNVGSAGEGDG